MPPLAVVFCLPKIHLTRFLKAVLLGAVNEQPHSAPERVALVCWLRGALWLSRACWGALGQKLLYRKAGCWNLFCVTRKWLEP